MRYNSEIWKRPPDVFKFEPLAILVICRRKYPWIVSLHSDSLLMEFCHNILAAINRIDCSQSPYFFVGFSRPVRFYGTAAILVCKSERDLGRVSKLPRGAGVSVSIVSEGIGKRKNRGYQLRSPPLGSLDTLPRSRSILQTKMVAAPSNRNPTEK